MPAEFEDPGEAPGRARGIGQQQILRWAVLASAAGAVLGLLRHVLRALGIFEGAGGFSSEQEFESLMTLHYLSGMAMPFVVVGAGLAVAATVEARCAKGTVPRGVVRRLAFAWGFLAAGAGGVALSAG